MYFKVLSILYKSNHMAKQNHIAQWSIGVHATGLAIVIFHCRKHGKTKQFR